LQASTPASNPEPDSEIRKAILTRFFKKRWGPPHSFIISANRFVWSSASSSSSKSIYLSHRSLLQYKTIQWSSTKP